MKKNSLFLACIAFIFCLLSAGTTLFAAPVDSLTALRAAKIFYQHKSGHAIADPQARVVRAQRFSQIQDRSGQSPAFYIVNFDHGFVIVSTDTRVKPIIGYSTESSFYTAYIPESLEDLLNDYAQEIEHIITEISDNERSMTNEWQQLLSNNFPEPNRSIVGPLLTTLWNQNYPYNILCPEDANGPNGHAFAGCVATAMAQIIRYWRHPTNGVGSHSYNSNNSAQNYGNYGTLSANFSTANYDYSQMPNSINANSPQNQINEVAKLIYHCGVAVDMMYGPNGSGAFDSDAKNAFVNYFGYRNAQIITRYYNQSTWVSKIKNELNNLRPVYYSGNGNSGGHAFVCDGYDENDYFHFNWGWSGSNNGFFSISNLNPGTYDFSSNQAAIIGIDASHSMIYTSTDFLSFFIEQNTISESKSISVVAASLSSTISVTVTGAFKISTNNTTFSTNRTLSSTGGTLYVRYEPNGSTTTDYGLIILTSGSVSDTVFLTGNTYNNEMSCNPPQNLVLASPDLQHVNLQWDAPEIVSDPQTISWSSEHITNLYGYGSDYSRSMLQRYCDTDLISFHNMSLTAIRFYAIQDATTYKAVVYKGGSYTSGSYDPGTLVVSQDIPLNSLTFNSWNTVTLNTPVTIDARQELWFGIYVEAPGGSHVLALYSNSVPLKGSIYGAHSTYYTTWGEFNPELSFCIIGIVDYPPLVTDYQIERNGTVLGTTSNTSWQDVVSSTDTYLYSVTANWCNGCTASVEGSFTNVAQLSCTPNEVNFFSNQGFVTSIKKVKAIASGLTASIHAEVSGNFLISTDSIHYSNTQNLPATGGDLFVKYSPDNPPAEYETGLITLTSGNLNATVLLLGQDYNECYPPQNLTISSSGNSVGLQWDAPVAQVIQQDTLSWYENTAGINYGNGSSATQLYTVQRFDVSDLVPYHGKQLTAVSFIPVSQATAYRIVVYKGGRLKSDGFLASGTQVTNQVVNLSSLTAGTWNTIPLNEPVTIDANQELWFGIYLESSSGYPIVMGTPYVSKKSNICKYPGYSDNYWSEMFEEQYNYCFSLRATIEDAPISLSHYKIDRNETTLAETNNTSYNDQVFYNGDYNYTVWAVWNNGCQALTHGSITLSGLCDPSGQSTAVEVCDHYTWHGTNYSESGVYTYEYSLPGGCPAIDTLFLTVNHGTHNVETVTACEEFTWHDRTYGTSGTYTFAYNNEFDCPSVDATPYRELLYRRH